MTPRRGTVDRIALTLVRNFPIVLLFAAAYFVFFSALWGALVPWKLALAGVAVLSTSLALGEPRTQQRGKARLAENARRWPWWRQCASAVAGGCILFAGIYQAFSGEVPVGRYYPLLSGLCLLVSAAFGFIFILQAEPHRPWRRRYPRPPPDLVSPRPRPAPKRTRPGGGSMKVPVPRDGGFRPGFGGLGSKPAPRAWMPGAVRLSGDAGPVPEKYRRLRLTRGTRARMERGRLGAVLLLALLAAALIAFLWWAFD